MSGPERSEVDLFTEAVQLPAEHRSAFLEAACGADSELQANVEALLKALIQSGEFLEEAPAEVKAQARVPGEKPGDWVGRYKLLQQIGEGGCGVVFMAEQEEPLRRKVAIKIVKPGMDTKAVVARFEAERQALALMDHPSIARVLDAGATEGGRPYFVMELIQGGSLADAVERYANDPKGVASLVEIVARVVHYAHEQGVLHRDLKPANILLDKKGRPRVSDFGLAKLFGDDPAVAD